jgi:hypothetical protein
MIRKAGSLDRAGLLDDLGKRWQDQWPPHEELNLDFRFRRPVFYPLNYGEAAQTLYGAPQASEEALRGTRIITDPAEPPSQSSA